MMKIVVDSPFPQYVEQLGFQGLTFHRWPSDWEGSDVDLARAAQEEGFSGIAFLGNGLLASATFVEVVSQLSIFVLVVHSDDPASGGLLLREHCGAIINLRGRSGLYEVLARGLRPFTNPG